MCIRDRLCAGAPARHRLPPLRLTPWRRPAASAEVGAAALVWARFVAVVQCAYALYYHRAWLGELFRGLNRPLTIGEA